MLTFIALAVPVVLVASLAGAMGNPLAAVFAVAAALAFPAVAGGSIDATLRSAGSARVYLLLAAEAVVWGGFVAAVAAACLKLSRRLADHAPPRVEPLPRGADGKPTAQATSANPAMPPEDAAGAVLGLGGAVVQAVAEKTRLAAPLVQLLLGAVVTALVGGLLAGLIVRSIDPWQVVWGLVIAFTLAGLIAHQLFPAPSPVAILVGPLLAAAACYALQAVLGGSGDAFRAAYFEGRLLAPALALPVYYASAGVVGASLGIGWSQVIYFMRDFKDEDEELPEPHVPAES
jgi:hypothetical protein